MVLISCCEAVIALFLPPLAVFLRTGCSLDLLINIGLCICGWIPGIIHAELVICFVPGLREKHRLKQERRQSQREVIEYYDERPHYHHHHRDASRQIEYGTRAQSPGYADRRVSRYEPAQSPSRSTYDYPPRSSSRNYDYPPRPSRSSRDYHAPSDSDRRSVGQVTPYNPNRRSYDYGPPRTGY